MHFKKAAAADPDSSGTWKQWAEFEERSGDSLQFVYKAIRSVELGENDILFCSHTAGVLLRVLKSPEVKELFPPHRRSSLVAALRLRMEQHRAQRNLSAEGLNKLGWLYMSEYSLQAIPNGNFWYGRLGVLKKA